MTDAGRGPVRATLVGVAMMAAAAPLWSQQTPPSQEAVLRQLRERTDSLMAARNRAPGDQALAVELASAFAASGQIVEALALHDTLLADPAPEPVVFRHVGRFWLAAAAADTAASLLSRGVVAHSGDPQLWTLLGYARGEAGQDSAAADAYREASGWASEPAFLDVRRARHLAAAERAEEARAIWRGLVRSGVPFLAPLLAAEDAAEAGEVAVALELLDAANAATGGEAVNPWVAEARWRVLRQQGSQAGGQGAEEIAVLSGSLAAMATRLEAESLPVERLRAGLLAGLERVAQGERLLLSGGARPDAPTAEGLVAGVDLRDTWGRRQLDRDRVALEAVLDHAVLGRTDGRATLAELQVRYPGSRILQRYAVRLDAQEGAGDAALQGLERLLAGNPNDAELHTLRGSLLESRGELAAARRSYGIALELEAGNRHAFQALLRLHSADGELGTLLRRVQRLRFLDPEDTLRMDQELELLHRLGRLEEARALAAQRGETARILRGGGA